MIRDDLRGVVDAARLTEVVFTVPPTADLRPRRAVSRRELAEALLAHDLPGGNVVDADAEFSADGALVVRVRLGEVDA